MLPEIIEIVPLEKPVKAEITVPGSKSITNRALILAALADGPVTLKGALWSEDTEAMFECLQKLGFEIRQEADPAEPCNRTVTVKGLGGKIPNGGTSEKPLELFVANAGTAARFLAAFVCLGQGTYRLSGIPRMHERPQAALFQALRELGYRVESENGNDKLPVRIHGEGPQPGECRVSVAASSQFASALLLSAGTGQWQVAVDGENTDELPYVVMTERLVAAFPKQGGDFQIEPDASSGSYFVAAECFVKQIEFMEYSEQFDMPVRTQLLNPVKVNHWPTSGWQIDGEFPRVLLDMPTLSIGLELARKGELDPEKIAGFFSNRNPLPDYLASRTISRQDDLGDSIMTAIILAPFSVVPFRFTDLGRLRVQECERVVALRTELTKCGAKVIEEGDTLTVHPSALHGAEIETYNDHRMAMCFATLALKVPGIRIKNPACVKKTFPNFFQKLAAAPPAGLGAQIWEIKNGQRTRLLSGPDLFAD